MRYRIKIRADLLVISESKDQGPSGAPEAFRFCRILVTTMDKNPGARPSDLDNLVGVPGRPKVDARTSCAPVCDLPHYWSSESEDQGGFGTPDTLKLRRSLVTNMAKHPGARSGDLDDLVGVPGCPKVDVRTSCTAVRDAEDTSSKLIHPVHEKAQR